MVRYIILFLFLIVNTANAAEISAYLDKSEYHLGEQINLYIDVKTGHKYQLLLEDLEATFPIISRRKVSSTNIVNGAVTSSETTVLTLKIDKAGGYTIPPIKVRAAGIIASSSEIFFKINNYTDLSDKYSDLFSATFKLNTEKIYISENLILTIILSKKTNNIANETYIPPESDDFIIERLGEAKSFSKKVDNQKVTFVEITYLLIPLKTGKLAVDLGEYELGIIDYNNNNDPLAGFLSFSPSASVKKLSFPVTKTPLILDVLDIPHNEALNVLDYAKIDVKTNTHMVNIKEPIEYTVTLTANNIKAENIGEIRLEDGRFKIYAEEEININKFDNKSSTYNANKSRKFILIPKESGALHLPSFTYSWFDKKTNAKVSLKSKPVIVNVTGDSPPNFVADTNKPNKTTNNTHLIKSENSNLLMLVVILCILLVIQFVYIAYLHFRKVRVPVSADDYAIDNIVDNHSSIISDNYGNLVRKTLIMAKDKYALSSSSIGGLIKLIDKLDDGNKHQSLILLLQNIDSAQFAQDKGDYNYQDSYKKISAEFEKINIPHKRKASKKKFNLNP